MINRASSFLIIGLCSLFLFIDLHPCYAGAFCLPYAKDPSPIVHAARDYLTQKKGWKKGEFQLDPQFKTSAEGFNIVRVTSDIIESDENGKHSSSGVQIIELQIDRNCNVVKELPVIQK